MANSIKVLIADDSTDFCTLLIEALEEDNRIKVVGVCTDGYQTLQNLSEKSRYQEFTQIC